MSKPTRRQFLAGGGTAAVLYLSGCKHRIPPTIDLGAKGAREPGGAEQVTVATRINGEARELAVHPHADAVTVLRDGLGLTGAKRACGQGVCGACTIHVGGRAVASCLLPATALEGQEVLTVEGLPAELHPVQRAFLEKDALQCGFCTPGFVMSAVAFHDEWRRTHGSAAPSREQVAAALAGNVCRCGAQEGILAAVIAACAGEHDGAAPPSTPRHDGREKVTGRATYTVDVRLPGMLEGRILRSPHAHARVRRIDVSRVSAIPGVHAVLRMLGEDGIVRYAGQEIAAVAAEDRRTADAALAAIEVDYEELPVTLSIERAMREDAEPVYASRKRYAPTSGEGPKIPSVKWEGNLRGPFSIFSKHRGDADDKLDHAREKSHPRFEGTFTTEAACHSAMEPHAAVAAWDGDELTLHVSTQAVVRMREDVAHRWEMPESRVRVLAAHVGGGFGSKASVTSETIAAVDLARAAGAPVRVALDRREELCVGGYRPATRTELTLAADGDGKFGGMRVRAYGDAGVAVGNAITAFFRVTYSHEDEPKDLKEWDVLTHAPPGQPFRAPGGPPAFFALEQAVDALAIQRGEDPIALRRRWDTNPPRRALYDWAETLPVWKERGARTDRGRLRRGVGLAIGGWFHFPQVDIRVETGVDEGRLAVWCATQDMGNGTRTVMADAVARVFGVAPASVEVHIGDSHHVKGPMSAGSRTTASIVPATERAARLLRDELAADHAARSPGARATERGVELADGKLLPWADVIAAAPSRRVSAKRPKKGEKHFLPFAANIGGKVMVGRSITGSLQIVEVEVDTRLGKVRVREVWGGYGAGRIVNPRLARSQAEGGVIQGIGYALFEERRLDPSRGFLLSESLDHYHLPGIGDVPPIHTHFHEEGFENALDRIVGLAELVTVPMAAAVANAVTHATGFRPMSLPIRVDRVLAGVRA